MRTTFFIAIVFLLFMVVGLVAQELQITSTIIEIPETPPEPSTGNILVSILLPLIWAFNAVASFFQIMTFQVDIPPLANLLILTPISIAVYFIAATFIRGGNTS